MPSTLPNRIGTTRTRSHWVFFIATWKNLLHFLLSAGYYVRKYIHNFHSRKRYLRGLATKNEIIRYVVKTSFTVKKQTNNADSYKFAHFHRKELDKLAVQSAKERAREEQDKEKVCISRTKVWHLFSRGFVHPPYSPGTGRIMYLSV